MGSTQDSICGGGVSQETVQITRRFAFSRSPAWPMRPLECQAAALAAPEWPPTAATDPGRDRSDPALMTERGAITRGVVARGVAARGVVAALVAMLLPTLAAAVSLGAAARGDTARSGELLRFCSAMAALRLSVRGWQN